MVESNYDILGIVEGSTEAEIRDAFRRLALQFHADRGGENEQFIKIKQAYEDLKVGKKYPDTDIEKLKNAQVYTNEDIATVLRNNRIFGQQISKEMATAQEWAAALNRSNVTAIRLFGSKTWGEIEMERKATGALSIKGNFRAGSFQYDGAIIMQGSISNPSLTEEYQTNIEITRGDFKLIEPIENQYKIENGARIIVHDGDIFVGNIFGDKSRADDPEGRVGVYQTLEHRTFVAAPKGKILADNIVNTVHVMADTIMLRNAEDDVILEAHDVLFYGGKLTYDCIIKLKQGGTIRFFEDFSIQGLSGDAIIELENGKKIRLFNLKTRKIHDLADEFVPDKDKYGKDATMVGKGFTITYDMLDNLSKKPKRRWGFGRSN